MLRPGGTAVVSDLYAASGACDVHGSPMARALYPRAALEAYFAAAFALTSFTDHTAALTAFTVQKLWDGTLCDCVSKSDLRLLRRARPGYGVWVWTKR